MRREGSLLALLEGEGKGRGSSQIPRRQRNHGERDVLETPATRKESFGWRARRSRAHGGAALPAPSEGAAPANISRACSRREGGEAAFWATKSQGLPTHHPCSTLKEQRGCPLPACAPGHF